MNQGWEFLEWIRLSIRHREEELELLRKMESDTYRRQAESGSTPAPGERPMTAPGSASDPESYADPFVDDDSDPSTPDAQDNRLTRKRLDDRIRQAAVAPASTFPEVPRRPVQPSSDPAASTVTPTPSEHAGKEAYERAAIESPPTLNAESEAGPADSAREKDFSDAEAGIPVATAWEETKSSDSAVGPDFVSESRPGVGTEVNAGSPPEAEPKVATEVPPGAPDGPSWTDFVRTRVPLEPDAAPEPEPIVDSVLLMEQDGCWVAFPWTEVDRVALTEEIPISSGHRFRFSLRNLLASRSSSGTDSAKKHSSEAEPFVVLWKRDHGISLLCCRRFGGITSTKEALGRSVEWMVRPPRIGEGREPQVVRLSEVAQSGPHLKPKAPADPPAAKVIESIPAPGVAADPPAAKVIESTPAPGVAANPPAAKVIESTPAPGVAANPPAAKVIESIPAPGVAANPPAAKVIESTPAAGETGDGPRRRVLLAVPYLPVRVALSRSFRRADWDVTEEFDPARVRTAIQDQDYDALFLDLADPLDPDLVQLLDGERFANLSLIAIGSRFQTPHESATGRLARAPRLHFPFQDDDVGRVVESLSQK